MNFNISNLPSPKIPNTHASQKTPASTSSKPFMEKLPLPKFAKSFMKSDNVSALKRDVGKSAQLLKTLFALPVSLMIPERENDKIVNGVAVRGKISKGEIASCVACAIGFPIIAIHVWTAAALLIPIAIGSAAVSLITGEDTQKLMGPPAKTRRQQKFLPPV